MTNEITTHLSAIKEWPFNQKVRHFKTRAVHFLCGQLVSYGTSSLTLNYTEVLWTAFDPDLTTQPAPTTHTAQICRSVGRVSVSWWKCLQLLVYLCNSLKMSARKHSSLLLNPSEQLEAQTPALTGSPVQSSSVDIFSANSISN